MQGFNLNEPYRHKKLWNCSRVAVPFTLQPAVYEWSSFSISSPAFDITIFYLASVIGVKFSHCGLICISLNNNDV